MFFKDKIEILSFKKM